MSGVRVELVPEALREIEDAIDWYRERSPRTAEAFARETERAVQLIAADPRIWPHFEAGTRRYVLRKFPYSIIYREQEDRIEIVAMAHHKRQPRYWQGR